LQRKTKTKDYQMVKQYLFSLILTLFALSTNAAVTISEAAGWYESAYVTWQKVAGMDYHVYVAPAGTEQWTQLDSPLVREYPAYGRADALGLKAGSYQLKVVPVQGGTELVADATTTDAVEVKAHDRSGFAHVGVTDGIGAYKNDGTLKDNAKVLYVWAGNAKTVTCDVVTNGKGGKTTGKGLQDIVTLYQKGYDLTPLAIRLVGTISAADMDRFDSSAEGLQIKGKKNYSPVPITIEGVGCDATIYGFGILCRNASNVEFRNFAIMLCMDDCLSMDTGNSNIWVHNMDFFYGKSGSDSDQVKGDGTVDIKGKSMNVTVSYNHFFDCGKTSLGGMKSETTDCWMSYHHNWFDHSDSRHPRIRTAFYHVYNNYFDGVSKYGVGVTYGGSAFVEANYFRNTKYPMLISRQGTDAEGNGTFSGETGGVIKAYNNLVESARKLKYYTEGQTDGDWDAVLVSDRNATVAATAFSGGTPYNNEADEKARTTYIENKIDDPADVESVVKDVYGAGRLQHGDFHWTFDNAQQDDNADIIPELKTALQNYKSQLVGFFGGGETGLTALTVSYRQDDRFYDLAGRRITAPHTGNIYIQNGKRIVVKK
jgi:pectate lyase